MSSCILGINNLRRTRMNKVCLLISRHLHATFLHSFSCHFPLMKVIYLLFCFWLVTIISALNSFFFFGNHFLRLSRWRSGKESTCQCRRHRRRRFSPWVEKIPWSRKWQPTPVFLPGKLHGQRSLVGYSPWGRKESDTTE